MASAAKSIISYLKGGIIMAVSTTLKQVRTERNICQEDLAVAIGSCGRTIGRIERGERNASLELALRISKYLGISVEELFSIDEGSSRREI